MNQRIKTLRENSLKATNCISSERAELITRFYRDLNKLEDPVPVQRAKAFAYFLEYKELCILPGELIVGERGPKPKATPTYPEVSLHSLADLEMLHSRKKVSFKADEACRRVTKKKLFLSGKKKTTGTNSCKI